MMLAKDPTKGETDPAAITHPQRLELIWHLHCLLLLAAVVVDMQSDVAILSAYIANLVAILDKMELSPKETSNNIMWLLQISDQSEFHSRRILHAAGWGWVCKHVDVRMQRKLKEWSLSFLKGEWLG